MVIRAGQSHELRLQEMTQAHLTLQFLPLHLAFRFLIAQLEVFSRHVQMTIKGLEAHLPALGATIPRIQDSNVSIEIRQMCSTHAARSPS